jgi:hypothetical protein
MGLEVAGINPYATGNVCRSGKKKCWTENIEEIPANLSPVARAWEASRQPVSGGDPAANSAKKGEVG